MEPIVRLGHAWKELPIGVLASLRAHRSAVIALAFFGLAAYVTVDPSGYLFEAAEDRVLRLGILLATLCRTPSAVAESKRILLCTCRSGVLLVGLVLNCLFGWSWAHPLVARVIVAVSEGRDA